MKLDPWTREQRHSLLIKRYARSGLYDTAARRYVSADELRSRTRTFVVIDTETGEDVTRVLLS